MNPQPQHNVSLRVHFFVLPAAYCWLYVSTTLPFASRISSCPSSLLTLAALASVERYVASWSITPSGSRQAISVWMRSPTVMAVPSSSYVPVYWLQPVSPMSSVSVNSSVAAVPSMGGCPSIDSSRHDVPLNSGWAGDSGLSPVSPPCSPPTSPLAGAQAASASTAIKSMPIKNLCFIPTLLLSIPDYHYHDPIRGPQKVANRPATRSPLPS